jgi:hypothetical protein
MVIRIRGLIANNNGGDGIRIEGDVDLDAEDVRAEGNEGQGVAIFRYAPLMSQLGLPRETDPAALAEVLQMLQHVAPQSREEAVRSSGAIARLWKGSVDASSLVNNVVSIASNPAVQNVIAQLLRGGA